MLNKNKLVVSVLLLCTCVFNIYTIYAKYESEREDIYDYKEFFDDLYPIDEEEDNCSPTSSAPSIVYAECKGVRVEGYGTYDLETYVAGVLNAEFVPTIENENAGKAAAIAIRSYTLAETKNCKKPIGSSSASQNFAVERDGTVDTEKYKKYADMTAGMVMTDTKGEIISGVYSLARADDCIPTGDGKCKFQRCTRYTETLSSCPSKRTEFIVPSSTIFYSGNVHYGGLEAYISQYLAEKEGYTYDKLLKAFYGDDIKISYLSGVDKDKNDNKKKSDDSENKTEENETDSTEDETDNKKEESNEEDENETKKNVVVDKSKYKLLSSKLKVTTYTGAAEENGGFAGKIALSDVNGGNLADGMIAVRLFADGSTWIPYKTVVYVETKKSGEGSYANGKFFYVADNGGLTQDEQIDVYCEECDKKKNVSMANVAPYGTYNNAKIYIVKKNVSWKDYLKNYYHKSVNLQNKVEKDSENACVSKSDDKGEYVNVNGISFPVKNYNIDSSANGLSKYFDLSDPFVSQCPWYAKHRAIEIVMESNLSDDLKKKAKAVLSATTGDGIDWYAGTNQTLRYFKYSNDVTKPKAGSLVSWSRYDHGYGHVAIVEKVNDDGTLVISEGWNNGGPDSTNGVAAIHIVTRTVDIEYMKTYGGAGKFVGYTYLFSHKE